jgi:hypothetical protein
MCRDYQNQLFADRRTSFFPAQSGKKRVLLCVAICAAWAISEYLTAEALVMRKNQNLRFRGVRVDRQFFHSQKTTVFSRCVDPNCLSSA